jgi:3-deoxy-manno-octulosonate cytidylyltransferase (CMP-KDO synthetase)
MPNLDPDNIKNLNYLMQKNKCDIGTLASRIQNAKEFQNTNIVKVETFENLDYCNFLKIKDFFRKTISTNKENIYHHIGIYAFSKNALSRYVKLTRTKNEIKRKLEQMRALDNNIDIRVALSKSFPLGIDTVEDFLLIKKSMEYKG